MPKDDVSGSVKSTRDLNLRSVKPAVSLESDNDGTPDVSGSVGTKNGTIFGKIRDTFSSVTGTAGGALAGGFAGLKNSWFGVKTVSSGVSSVVGNAADFLHVPKRGLFAVLIVLLLGGSVTGGILFSNYQSQQVLFKQEDYYEECADLLSDMNLTSSSFPTTPGGNVDERQEEIAEKMWALGKALGFTDEQCAGMLGNMQQESSLDPTSVEGVFTEPYQIGSKKSSLFPLPSGAMDSYTTGELVEEYARRHKTINLSAYSYDGSHYSCGLGLIQWTGPLAKDLMDFADSNGKNWYDLDLQCARLIQGEAARLQLFLSDTGNSGSVAGATASWMSYMERGLDHVETSGSEYENRVNYANDWYARFSSQSDSISNSNSDFANSVISMAGTTSASATGSHVSALQNECGTTQQASDNSSLAAAAVAYAWETIDMGNGNNGTELYRAVHDAMFPGDSLYQSCDRGVASAVAWSGADDNFPVGATSEQDAYLSTHSDLWEPLGSLEDVLAGGGVGSLQPGDILITTASRRPNSYGGHGHIVMYVSNAEIQKKYPGASGECVSASWQTRSPGCGDTDVYSIYCEYDGGYNVYRHKGDYSGTKKNLYAGTASGTN